MFDAHKIQKIIGYKFKDQNLLKLCFTHSSYKNENKKSLDNERLEFLGDKILGKTVAEFLYKKYDKDESFMNTKLIGLVSTVPLSNAVKKMELGEFMLVGKGSDANLKDRVLEALFESLVAGVYLDGGEKCAEKFIYDKLIKVTDENSDEVSDYKSKFKEYCEKRKLKWELPCIDKKGKDNAPVFTVVALVNGVEISRAKGGKKGEAENIASKEALNILKKSNGKR